MAPFSWPVQAIGLLPQALRPGVFVALVVLLAWAVARGELPAVWRALCRGVARVLDLAAGALLRVEYAITSARRRRGQPPPQWAFALAPVTDGVEDGAAWLYARHRPAGGGSAGGGDGAAARAAAGSRRWRPVAIVCLAAIVALTAAWITMDRLEPTVVAKYRLAQAFGPWRAIEAWAGVDPGRGGRPLLLRAQHDGALVRARVGCLGAQACQAWLLLTNRSGGVVAVHAVPLRAGVSRRVELRLTREQLRAARGGSLRVARA